MYEPSGNERLAPIEPPLPEADPGAPEPRIAASEDEAVVAYWTPDPDRRVALVRFSRPREVSLGGPNDETINEHPLYRAGLRPYTFAEVHDSPWITALERRNRVHPGHDPSRFSALRHFVLPFHDTTVECIAEGVSATLTDAASPASALDPSS